MKRILALITAVGLVAFAGTCSLVDTSLTQNGTGDTYAAELINNTGANFLGHDFLVTFTGANGTVVEKDVVQGCLR